MPQVIPERAAILQRIATDFRVEVGVDPLRRSVEYALCRALMGQSAGLYGLARFYFKQLFPDTAEDQYLWRWVSIFLGPDGAQKPAEYWTGTVTFTGNDDSVIPDESVIVRSDGVQYTTTTAGTIASNECTLTVTSVDPGLTTSLEVGQPLSLGTPIAGVATSCVVASVSTTGEDPETVDAAQTRLLHRLSTPPRGGGPGDYVSWALEEPGCTRAWEYANRMGPNTVSVSFVRDGDGVGAAILPDFDARLAMQFDVQDKAPITVKVFVNELVAVPVPIVIDGLTPDTPENRAAIALSLQDQFSRDSVPGPSTIALSRIDSAISNAAGEFSHVLTSPATSPTAGVNEFLILGDISYGD